MDSDSLIAMSNDSSMPPPPGVDYEDHRQENLTVDLDQEIMIEIARVMIEDVNPDSIGMIILNLTMMITEIITVKMTDIEIEAKKETAVMIEEVTEIEVVIAIEVEIGIEKEEETVPKIVTEKDFGMTPIWTSEMIYPIILY
ncbi:hypothetical protein CEXT_552051 [Caerostris extrusa]|uniref:Uncharacterized protein n=1 Tax=Caerostris extrusa TaxID=172846 RepID=A0AAV4X887_CAEEX|nr:hypothetical protein CEXT_552051 [Caerostris extrusa]